MPDISRLPQDYKLVKITLDVKVPVPELTGFIQLRDTFTWDLEQSSLRPELFVNGILQRLGDSSNKLNNRDSLIESILDQLISHISRYSRQEH